MDHLLQISGVMGRRAGRADGLAEQLGGEGMADLAFNLKIQTTDRSLAMGIATAFLRVLGDEGKRAAEIMKA